MNKHQQYDLIFVDVEATHVDSSQASLLELGAIRCTSSAQVLGQFTAKTKPGGPVHPQAAEVNGYTKERWEHAVEPSTAFFDYEHALFAPFGDNYINVSYFLYDREVLVRERFTFPGSDRPWVNFADMTYPLILTGHIESRSLSALAKYLGVPEERKHTALGDATTLSNCWFAYLKRFGRDQLIGQIASTVGSELASQAKKFFFG